MIPLCRKSVGSWLMPYGIPQGGQLDNICLLFPAFCARSAVWFFLPFYVEVQLCIAQLPLAYCSASLPHDAVHSLISTIFLRSSITWNGDSGCCCLHYFAFVTRWTSSMGSQDQTSSFPYRWLSRPCRSCKVKSQTDEEILTTCEGSICPLHISSGSHRYVQHFCISIPYSICCTSAYS